MRVYETCKDGKEYPEGGCQERARLVEAPLRPPGKSSRSIAAEGEYAAAASRRYRDHECGPCPNPGGTTDISFALSLFRLRAFFDGRKAF